MLFRSVQALQRSTVRRERYDVIGLYLNPPEAVVLCVDEKSHVQALARSQPAFPMMPGRPAKRTLDYVRHGTTGLGVPLLGAPSGGVAAFNTADGTVISRLHRRHPGLGNPGPAAARRFTVLTPVRNAGNGRLRRCAGRNTWRDVLISSCISHRPPPPLTHTVPQRRSEVPNAPAAAGQTRLQLSRPQNKSD